MNSIYSSTSYNIVLQEKPDSRTIQLLKATHWGTNGPIYQHKDTEERILKMDKPMFFTLNKSGKVIGTCNFIRRKINVKDKIYASCYSRYFVIEKTCQGKIFGHLLLKNIKGYFEQNTIEPTVFYAYVDPDNRRSLKLLQRLGFNQVRTFETYVFSRIFPKADHRVSKIKNEEQVELLSLLSKQYENFTFINFEKLFHHDNYFVLRKDNNIVGGIRANTASWTIHKLPGFSGKMIVNLIPHVPLLSRLLNPKHFKFVAFDGIYCREGYEQDLFVLMESICAQLNLHTGILWMDADSELCTRLKRAGNWGIINKLKKNIPGYLIAGFKNINENEQDVFNRNPAYINALDLI